MGDATGLSQEQLLALDRIGKLPQAKILHLVGGSAIAVHFGHRRSEDLDIFSVTPDVDLHAVRASLAISVRSLVVRGETDVTLKVAADGTIIDFVRYPYAPLEPPTPGPGGVLLASVRDLGAMKLSAIATRGIRRDFWDAFVMAKNGHSLTQMAADFREKFGKEASDLYHVVRALTYFDDAEVDPILPRGMTPTLWKEVRTYFAREAPRLLQQLMQP
ncbi:MAG TPA: nucleotidyl transferase AbiEii/AbiGii toxin family protein [Labilithrix sp.]|nr:nucleotidyl transferase AbiEii/AbiGii toxin family protein [Labilithrix sp.]